MEDPLSAAAVFRKGVIAMESASILIVEDEPVVAKDIQLSLQRLGYKVPATATSGEDAIRKAGELRPDLILMDIVLKGKMDGVETVRRIQHHQDVPVIYLTAYADDHTLERAKVTAPAGYMLKPYQPNELRTTIELALHRAHHDRHMREHLRWIDTTMRSMGDGVVTTDRNGRVTYLNPAAEHLTGWSQEAAAGVSLTTLLGFEQEGPIQHVENPALHAMVDVRIVTVDEAELISKDGGRRLIRGSAAPVVGDGGAVLGAVLVFHIMPVDARRCGHLDDRPVRMLRDSQERLGRPQGVINLCAWCKRVPDQSGEWYDLETFITERSMIQFNGGLCPACMGRCFPESVRDNGRM
jgi:PAS domain S-box-containing protein